MPAVIPAAIALGGALASAAGAAGVGVLGATAFTIAGVSVTVGSVVGFVASVASTLLSVAFSGTGDRPDTQTVRPQTQAVQATIAEPARVRWFGHGKMRTGGALIFWRNTGPDDEGDMWRVIVFDCREINRVTGLFLNGERVEVDADGWVTTPDKWAGNVQIITTKGTADQTAIPELIAAFPGIWTEAHRGRGLAIAAIRQKPVAIEDAAETYPRGAQGEQLTIEAERALVYDPRTGLVGYSENAALHALDWLTNQDGFSIPLDELALDRWAAAADICDEPVDRISGITTPRYRCGGVTALDADRAQVLKAMLDNFDAALFSVDAEGGTIGPRISHDAPDPEIGAILGHHVLAISDSGQAGVFEEVRAVRSLFVDPERGYNDNTTPSYPPPVPEGTALRAPAATGATILQLDAAGQPGAWFAGRRFHLDGLLYRATAVAAAGDDVDVTITPALAGALPTGATIEAPGDVQEIDRPYCPDWGQAMRLDKKEFLRLAAAEPAEVSGTLALLEYRATETVTLGFPEAGRDADEWMRVEAVVAGEDGVSTNILVSSVPPDYDEWDAMHEEAENQLPLAISASGQPVSEPVLIAAEAAGNGLTRVLWEEPPDEASAIQLQWSPAGAADWQGLQAASPPGFFGDFDFSAASGLIDIRGRWVTGSAAVTAWGDVLTSVDPNAAPVEPPAPTITGPSSWPQTSVFDLVVSTSHGTATTLHYRVNGGPINTRDIQPGVDISFTFVMTAHPSSITLSAAIESAGGALGPFANKIVNSLA